MSLEQEIARRFSRSLRNDGFSAFTSVISLTSVAIGCIALIVSISILDGYEKLILETAMRYTSHIEVRSLSDNGIQDASALLNRIRRINGVESGYPITVRESLVRSRQGIAGAGIHGLDEDVMQRQFADVITDGSLPRSKGCVIGKTLAQQLGVGVGDTITFYTALRSEESIVPRLFAMPIAGIITTGMHTVDNSLVAMDRSELNAHFDQAATGPSVLAISVKDPEQAQVLVSSIMEIVGDESMVFTWKDRFQSISAWIELQRKPIPVILGLIAVVAAFTMISTLLVSVVEKTRSISILFSLGMTPRSVIRILLFRALRLSAIGSALGAAIAFLFALVQNVWHPISLDGAVYYVSSLPISLDPLPYLLIPLFSIALAVLASLVPMLAAMRINPVQGLRFQ